MSDPLSIIFACLLLMLVFSIGMYVAGAMNRTRRTSAFERASQAKWAEPSSSQMETRIADEIEVHFEPDEEEPRRHRRPNRRRKAQKLRAAKRRLTWHQHLLKEE